MLCWLMAVSPLAQQAYDWVEHHNAQGAFRAIIQPLPVDTSIEVTFSTICYASRGNPTLVTHLQRTMARLAPFLITLTKFEALTTQADAAIALAFKALTPPTDRCDVLQSYKATCASLGHPALGLPPAT
jgi:hypothetical protein